MANEDDDDRASSAADDPTAIWDETSSPAIAEAVSTPPATAPAASSGPTIQVAMTASAQATIPAARPQPSGGLSWTATIALALAVGAAVFFVVRYLRGAL